MSDETQSRTMACPDCGGLVSKRTASCPHCGAPIAAGEVTATTTPDDGFTKNNEDQIPEVQSEAKPNPPPTVDETGPSRARDLSSTNDATGNAQTASKGNKDSNSYTRKARKKRRTGNMTFAKKHLTKGETIRYAGRFHPAPIRIVRILTLLWMFASVVLATGSQGVSGLYDARYAILLPGIIFWLVFETYFRNMVYKTEFVLTDKRIIAKWGFLRIVIHEMPLEKIESINYGQTIIERWFWSGIGRLTVRGTSGGKIKTFPFLLDALEFRKRILAQIDKVTS